MSSFIFGMLKITVFSMVILAAVMLLRKVLRRHASPTLIYLLWFLLILRFVFPVTFESQTKLLVFEKRTNDTVSEATDYHSDLNESVFRETDMNNHGIDGQEATISMPSEDANQADIAASNFPSQNAEIQDENEAGILNYFKALDYSFYIIALWMAVCVILLSNMVLSAITLKRYLINETLGVSEYLNSMICKCKDELEIKSDIKTVVIDGLISPSITASLKPIIVIPEALLAGSEAEKLEYSIKHELMHFKRKDHITYLLIGVIKAVSWFNPIAYLMSKQMKMDMETACDSMVVKDMKDQNKINYAATILDMYAKNKEMPTALGMAIETTKKTAERRIRGIYMRRKSNRLAKVLTVFSASILLLVCFTTACVPSEAVPDLTAQEEMFENTALAENQSLITPQPTVKPKNLKALDYDIPSRLDYFIENDSGDMNITVEMAANVVIPEFELPIMQVRPKDISFGQVGKMVDMIIGETPLYDSHDAGYLRTKIKILEEIDYYEWELSMCDSEMTRQKEAYAEILEELRTEYETAPESYSEAVYVPADIIEEYEVFVEGDVAPTPTPMPESVDISSRIQPIFLSADNYDIKSYNLDVGESWIADSLYVLLSDEYKQKLIWYQKAHRPGEPYISSITKETIDMSGFSLTEEQALAVAQPYVDALDSELVLNEVAYAGGIDYSTEDKIRFPIGYTFYFTRQAQGVGVSYAEAYPLDIETKALEAASSGKQTEEYAQEYLEITVTVDGIQELKYYNPLEYVETLDESADLLPFKDIKNAFEEYIFQVNESLGEFSSGAHVVVSRVELSLMRVQTPGTDKYKLMPVWDFYGGWWNNTLIGETYEKRYFEPYARSFFTVNAVDGSVIDRDLGY